jgi:pimeloyl-ACP methyl ester carboxylesterase
MGGAAAQMVALNAPHLTRKLILAGTRPSIGPDTVAADWPLVERFTYAMESAAAEAAFTESFFTPPENGAKQARAYWERLGAPAIMDAETTQAQLNNPWTHVS